MADKHGHDRLSTWGVGRDHPEGFWRAVIRQLISHGALRTESGNYASLKLVPEAARPILRSEEKVMLRAEPERAPRPRRTAPAATTASASATAETTPLFEALREWRTAEARLQGVPPYVIFHDSVLRELAAARPSTLTELGSLRGVGASKLERYGAVLLTLLRAA